MLQLKNINGDETGISAYNIAVTDTLGSLSTLSFNFIADAKNQVGADMMIPRTIITEPNTGQQFRLLTSNPTPNSKYRVYAVTANHIGQDLHDKFIEKKLTATQSLKACLDLLVEGTRFSYKITGNFKNYSFSEGFGGDYADTLLSNLASDFGFEYYFGNYTITIAKSIGKTGAFLFVDGANVNKISVTEDYSTITTYMKGYAGKPDDNEKYPISAEYTSPLASKWGKIWGDIYTNENMNKPALVNALKSKVHDYPDVQYTLGYVDFRRNLTGFKNDTSVGNSGFLRDRYGIDVSVRIQSRTIYPQDTRNSGAITFGNTTYDPVVLQNQIRKAYKNNLKLGERIFTSNTVVASQAGKAYDARLGGTAVSGKKVKAVPAAVSVDDAGLPLYTLHVVADNPDFNLTKGANFAVTTRAEGVLGLDPYINSWISTNKAFVFEQIKSLIGTIKGDKGDPGAAGKDGIDGKNGEDGKSAYELWLDQDNSGTEDDFLKSLAGKPGKDGNKGDSGATIQAITLDTDETGKLVGGKATMSDDRVIEIKIEDTSEQA